MKNQKQILFLLFTFLCLGSSLHAQRGLRIGFNLAPNFARANFLDSTPEYFTRKYSPGITTGLALQYGVNNGISFYTGLLYSSKGFKIENDTNSFKKDIVGNVLSIEVPMGFYLRQPMSKRTFMREQVGITLNYNMNNERGFFRFPEQNPFAIETIVNKRMNFLVNIGVEIQHELDAGHFFSAGIVYRHGFGVPMSLNVLNDVDNTAPKYLEMAYTGGYLGINLSFLFNLSNLKPQKGELFFD